MKPASSETRCPWLMPARATALFALALLSCGCSLLTQPPNEARARELEEARSANERDAQARAEARTLEKQGLTPQEARSLSEAQRPPSRR